MDTEESPGLIHLRSDASVAATVSRLEALLAAKGIALLCRISHSEAAASVGLSMLPTELLIFGNPRVGTPLMLEAPSLAIDLPSKALVWQDRAGAVWLSYNTAEYLRQRHHVSSSAEGLSTLEHLLRDVTHRAEPNSGA